MYFHKNEKQPMRPYQLMLVHLVLGLVFVTGCGVDHGSGGPGGVGGVTLVISTTAAPFGVAGNAYSATLATTGGTAPFMWAVFGGVLPDGLTLNTTTGVMTGTPTSIAAGNSTVVFVVTDSIGKTATGSVLFVIHPRTDRVSVDSSGTAGSGVSSTPSINGDGSLVAFASLSPNFVATVNGAQIFVHNRQTNQIELISRDNSASVVNEGTGVSSAPSISADGRYVAFVSLAPNLLAPGPAVPAGQQIYVRDRQTGLTSLVSVDNNVAPNPSNPGNGVSSAPSISADGRYVAFVSQATNLLAPGTPAVPAGQQIYSRDRQLGQSFLVSQDNTNANVAGTGGVSDTPSMNSDGGFVAFFSQATNLVTGSGTHIYVRALP